MYNKGPTMHYVQHYGRQWRAAHDNCIRSETPQKDAHPTAVENLTNYIHKFSVYCTYTTQTM